jgi:hypothetical protein
MRAVITQRVVATAWLGERDPHLLRDDALLTCRAKELQRRRKILRALIALKAEYKLGHFSNWLAGRGQ